jgi:hypothetical protein
MPRYGDRGMNGYDRHQLLTAFVALITALFLASGMPGIGRWGQQLRRAAIIAYAVAAVLVLADVAAWLAGL